MLQRDFVEWIRRGARSSPIYRAGQSGEHLEARDKTQKCASLLIEHSPIDARTG